MMRGGKRLAAPAMPSGVEHKGLSREATECGLGVDEAVAFYRWGVC
ncbi:MAG: hypothetical protein ACK5PS_03745 [Desulfopila sp.]